MRHEQIRTERRRRDQRGIEDALGPFVLIRDEIDVEQDRDGRIRDGEAREQPRAVLHPQRVSLDSPHRRDEQSDKREQEEGGVAIVAEDLPRKDVPDRNQHGQEEQSAHHAEDDGGRNRLATIGLVGEGVVVLHQRLVDPQGDELCQDIARQIEQLDDAVVLEADRNRV